MTHLVACVVTHAGLCGCDGDQHAGPFASLRFPQGPSLPEGRFPLVVIKNREGGVVLVFPYPRGVQSTGGGAGLQRGPRADAWPSWGAGLSVLEPASSPCSPEALSR